MFISGCTFTTVSAKVYKEQPQQDNDEDCKKQDEMLLNVMRPDYERPAPPPPMEPLFPLREDGKVQGKTNRAPYMI